MDKQISSGLKTTFLIHFVVAGIFGLVLLLVPRMWGNLAGLEIVKTAIYRLVGAALLGFAASSWLAYKETVWERVRIVVQMEIVGSALGALVILWGLAFEGLPPLEWMNVVILAGFAIAFAFFYSRARAA
jgi:hypothetical protein